MKTLFLAITLFLASTFAYASGTEVNAAKEDMACPTSQVILTNNLSCGVLFTVTYAPPCSAVTVAVAPGATVYMGPACGLATNISVTDGINTYSGGTGAWTATPTPYILCGIPVTINLGPGQGGVAP